MRDVLKKLFSFCLKTPRLPSQTCCVNTRRFSCILFHHIPRKAELGILLSIYQRRRPSGLRLFFSLPSSTLSAAEASSAAAAALRILGTWRLLWSLAEKRKRKNGPRSHRGGLRGMKGLRVCWRLDVYWLSFSTRIKQLPLAVFSFFNNPQRSSFPFTRSDSNGKARKEHVVCQRSAHCGRVVGGETVEVWEWGWVGRGSKAIRTPLISAPHQTASGVEWSGDDGKTLRLPQTDFWD